MITMWIHRHTMVGSWGEDGRKYHSFVSPFEASLPERGCEFERERERGWSQFIKRKEEGVHFLGDRSNVSIFYDPHFSVRLSSTRRTFRWMLIRFLYDCKSPSQPCCLNKLAYQP